MKALLETGHFVCGKGMVDVEIDLPFKPLWAFIIVDGCGHCGGADKDFVLYSLECHKLILAGIINSESATVKWLCLGAEHHEHHKHH